MHYLRTSRYPKCLCGMPFDSTRQVSYVRPIGVGELPRQIIAKAVLQTVGQVVEKAACPLQVCTGTCNASDIP